MALNCDFVITVNHEIRDKIANCGFSAKKIFVLHNAIEVSERYQYKFRQKHKPLTIGIYGRIEHDKGFDILLDAAKILKNKAIDFRIKLGGFDVDSGYNTQDLYQLACQNKIAENCDFVGFVVDKKEFFQNVDIFCVPSRHESFGLTILDGFLFSTPVISSNTIGAKILIKNGENGLIFDNHDPEDLAQKIIAIANNEIDGERLAKTAYLKLQKEFSLPIFAKNLQKILHKILGDTQN